MRDFLVSRGIELPDGEPDDPPERETVWGLGNRKQLLVEDELERAGVEVFPAPSRGCASSARPGS